MQTIVIRLGTPLVVIPMLNTEGNMPKTNFGNYYGFRYIDFVPGNQN